MFFAQDNHIEDVRKIYQNMISGMESSRSDPGSKRKGAFLRFICDPHAKDSDGYDICVLVLTENFCVRLNLTHSSGGAHAQTTNIDRKWSMEEKYAFHNSASTVLCPPFFDDMKFPSTQVLEQDLGRNCNLDKVRSRGRSYNSDAMWLTLRLLSWLMLC